MSRRPTLLSALVLALLASAPPAWSESFVANVAYDALDADPNDGKCDVDLLTDNVQCTLRAAVVLANQTQALDDILLDLDTSAFGPPVTYTLTLSGAGEDAGASGDLDITTPISIESASENQGGTYDLVFIDGKKLKDRIFDVQAGGELTLKRTSLLHGKTASSDADPSGGCLRSTGSVTMNSVFFHRCSASADGGGASVSGGTFDATNVIYSLGKAKGEGGGLALAAGTADLVRNTFGKNRAGTGGAIATRGDLTLRHATLDGNRAKLGGGIAVLGAGATTISHATLSENGKTNLDASQNTGTLVVGGTIIWRGAPDCAGNVSSAGGNLEGGTSCGFTGASNQQNTDPELAPLNDYGGRVPVRTLAAGSPAIDRGLDDADACELDARLVYRARFVPPITGATSMADVGATDYDTDDTLFDMDITSTAVTTATVGVPYSYDLEATNPQREPCITFSLQTSPAGMTIDSVTGVISWTPTADQAGNQAVTVDANSNGATNSFDDQSFVITVDPAP